MNWWPFGKKLAERSPAGDETDEIITLYQTDPPHVRAEKIFRAGGLGMNHNALAMIPSAADAIAAYQQMDTEAAARGQD